MKKWGVALIIIGALVTILFLYDFVNSPLELDRPMCPDSSSIFIKKVTCENDILNVTLKNNGRFSLDGFVIRTSDDINHLIATENIYNDFIGDSESNAIKDEYHIRFNQFEQNSFEENKVSSFWFDITSLPYGIEYIEVDATMIVDTEYEDSTLAVCGISVREEVRNC